MKNSKISNIYSAHNHPTEKPIPHKEIRESCCINCGNEMKIGDFITYTILHNKKVLWWHRRKSVNELDPCPKIKIKIDKRSSVIQRNVIWKDKQKYYQDNRLRIRAKQKERYEKTKSIRKQRLNDSASLSNDQLVEPQ